MSRHFMQSHIRRVYTCLAVTCHPHFSVAERSGSFTCYCGNTGGGWGGGVGDGYRNKNQHRKLTLEKKILPPILPGLEPETFDYESNH